MTTLGFLAKHFARATVSDERLLRFAKHFANPQRLWRNSKCQASTKNNKMHHVALRATWSILFSQDRWPVLRALFWFCWRVNRFTQMFWTILLELHNKYNSLPYNIFCPTNFWQVYSSVDVDFIIAISILTTSSTLVATIGSWYKRFDCDRCKTECSLFARVAKVWKDHNNWTSTIDVNRGGARWSFNDLPFSWFNKINVLLWVV